MPGAPPGSASRRVVGLGRDLPTVTVLVCPPQVSGSRPGLTGNAVRMAYRPAWSAVVMYSTLSTRSSSTAPCTGRPPAVATVPATTVAVGGPSSLMRNVFLDRDRAFRRLLHGEGRGSFNGPAEAERAARYVDLAPQVL